MRVVTIVPGWPSIYTPNMMPWLYHQVKGLARTHEITVLVLESWTRHLKLRNLKFLFKKNAKTFLKSDESFKVLPVYYFSFPRMLFYRRITFRSMMRSLRRLVKKNDFSDTDIIHAHFSSPTGYLALWLSRKISRPYIITEHASYFPELFANGVKVEESIREASAVICVSQKLADHVKRLVPLSDEKVCIIPNGVDLSLFTGGDKKNRKQPHLLSVGYLIPRKGFDVLLKALVELKKRAIHPKLTIIGKGPEKKGLADFIRKNGLAENVYFAGEISNHRMPEFYRNADVLVIASRRESFGVTAIEALASGVPVIATRCGGPEEILTPDVGLVVEPENPMQLVDAIQQITQNKPKYNSEKLIDYIDRNYSVSSVTHRISEVYTEIAG